MIMWIIFLFVICFVFFVDNNNVEIFKWCKYGGMSFNDNVCFFVFDFVLFVVFFFGR